MILLRPTIVELAETRSDDDRIDEQNLGQEEVIARCDNKKLFVVREGYDTHAKKAIVINRFINRSITCWICNREYFNDDFQCF